MGIPSGIVDEGRFSPAKSDGRRRFAGLLECGLDGVKFTECLTVLKVQLERCHNLRPVLNKTKVHEALIGIMGGQNGSLSIRPDALVALKVAEAGGVVVDGNPAAGCKEGNDCGCQDFDLGESDLVVTIRVNPSDAGEGGKVERVTELDPLRGNVDAQVTDVSRVRESGAAQTDDEDQHGSPQGRCHHEDQGRLSG